ncbi:hypothetical protein L7F22_060347 [Adiantum nelumboides]|nr:hypothetical protein [Adiantum nelumboides]
MASAESPHWPWPKGLRRWSRGPSLCKLISKAKTSFRCKLAIAKLLRQASSSSSSPPSTAPPSAAPPTPPSASSLGPPPSHEAMQRSTSLSSPSNSVLAGAMAIANCLRRHSDAIAPPGLRMNPSLLQQRVSLDSVLTTHEEHNFSRLGTLLTTNAEQLLPNVSRLGTPKSNFYTTRSLTYNTSSDILSMGSPLVSKVKDACTQLGHVAKRRRSSDDHHHPLDLFIGNPFLTHINPAPISSLVSNGDHFVTPSSGFLNASSKAKDYELKDRIVFFA